MTKTIWEPEVRAELERQAWAMRQTAMWYKARGRHPLEVTFHHIADIVERALAAESMKPFENAVLAHYGEPFEDHPGK